MYVCKPKKRSSTNNMNRLSINLRGRERCELRGRRRGADGGGGGARGGAVVGRRGRRRRVLRRRQRRLQQGRRRRRSRCRRLPYQHTYSKYCQCSPAHSTCASVRTVSPQRSPRDACRGRVALTVWFLRRRCMIDGAPSG